VKKYLIVFILLLAIGFFYFYNPFKLAEDTGITTDKSKFISLQGNTFIKDGKPFYPLAVNYIVGLQMNRKEIWPCPSKSYNPIYNHFEITNRDSCYKQLVADMDLIKEMGFNTVRIIGIADLGLGDKQTGELYFRPSIGNEKDTTIIIGKDNYEQYFGALDKFIHILDSMNLKAIVLAPLKVGVNNYERHLEKLTKRYKNNPTIMSYDFFNEPLYFDTLERKKEEVYAIVSNWQKLVKKNAHYHLTTIGLEGIREVFEWDPNILPVDFVSLHPYEYEPEQVRNEIYWYSKYIKKPWIIGETSIPADDDSVKYDEQKLFAEKTLKQTLNCGALGYSWWQYKDVEWFMFHANFMGLVNLKEQTKTKSGLVVKGTVKPTAEAFKKFNPNSKNDSCLCLDNYYNYSKGKECRIIGKMVDDKGNPIMGGVVLAWSKYWDKSYHTITKNDGTFELLGTFPFYHWMASATEYNTYKGEINADTAQLINNIKTLKLGTLKFNKVIIVKK